MLKYISFELIYIYIYFLAITLVAFGTSLPDTLSARALTKLEKTADGPIVHITGSISVNVLMGVSMPWLVAAIYHESQVL